MLNPHTIVTRISSPYDIPPKVELNSIVLLASVNMHAFKAGLEIVGSHSLNLPITILERVI